MRDLGMKLILFIVCTCLISLDGFRFQTTAVFVLSFIVTCLCTYFSQTKIAVCLLWGYCLLCFIFPVFGLYLPLLFYDSCRNFRHLTLPVAIVATLQLFFRMPYTLAFSCLILSVFSFLLSLFSEQLDKLKNQLHLLQDDSREATLILKERNRALMEKQDSEIHVATLSERNRIAREIHDNVGHMLTRSLLQTGALKIMNREPALVEPLATLHDTLNTAMTSIRNSVHDLHDESIDLYSALQDAIAGVEKPSIHLDYDIGDQVPRNMKYAFVAIVKEALQNIHKHSNADSAQIILREHPGFYHLQIQDNGTVEKIRTENGIGLSNMEERVHALHGTIRFSTEKGFGIFITIMKNENKYARNGRNEEL
ncbi:MAG: two-component sensor histidine kinase [Lachnospiraceae bacterium]|nr:two-component sensor histidine kinase [Lachnospiraceae bacterium]